jgi:hypothetical protein
LNIIWTLLSSSASNYDLFRGVIVSDPSCRCGAALENLKHFYLDCSIYLQARTALIGNLNRFTTCYNLHIKFLTCGNVNWDSQAQFGCSLFLLRLLLLCLLPLLWGDILFLSCPSVCLSVTQFVSATPLKLLNRISWNLVDSKDTICSCAYYQEILITWILWELCPFELNNFPKYTSEAACQRNSSETTKQNFLKLGR